MACRSMKVWLRDLTAHGSAPICDWSNDLGGSSSDQDNFLLFTNYISVVNSKHSNNKFASQNSEVGFRNPVMDGNAPPPIVGSRALLKNRSLCT